MLFLFPYTTLFRSSVVVCVTGIGPVYAVDAVVGVLPSVVEWIVTRVDSSVRVTSYDAINVPPAGLNVGVATSGTIVYVALATLLFAIPLAAASARSVVVCVTGIGPVYTVDAVVGVLPSVV